METVAPKELMVHLTHDMMARITSDCGSLRSIILKWPWSARRMDRTYPFGTAPAASPGKAFGFGST